MASVSADEHNPFSSPQPEPEPRPRNPSRTDPSIENEPHLRQEEFAPDASEQAADRVLPPAERASEDEQVAHSVWNEPALAGHFQQTGQTPDPRLTYRAWLERKIEATDPLTTWLVTLGIALSAGPWAVLGALLTPPEQGGLQLVMVTVVGPLTEEVMKIAVALWVVEKRPYLYGSAFQIGFCAVAGGLAFAVIENLLYLYVYIPDASAALAAWRWSVCTVLHMGCSFIAGLGLVRIWQRTLQTKTPPELTRGIPLLITAVVVHGLYNGSVLVLEQTILQF